MLAPVYKFLSTLIMPSQTTPLTKNSVRTARNEDGISITNNFIAVNETTKINYNEYHDLTRTNQASIIINVVGNGNIFEYFDRDYIEMARGFPACKIVGFNFRNVQLSEGEATCPNDWINDLIALVDHYCKKGIPAENILLLGNSLGAADATLATTRLHQKGQKVKLLNVRSFSDLSVEIVQSILPQLSRVFDYYLVKLTSLHLARGFLRLLFGNMYPLSDYLSLPEDSKDYICAMDDKLIAKGARIHDGLKEINRQKKKLIRDELQNPAISAERFAFLEAELLNIKDSKLKCVYASYDAHNDDLKYLITAHKGRSLAGNEVLDNKIKRLLKL